MGKNLGIALTLSRVDELRNGAKSQVGLDISQYQLALKMIAREHGFSGWNELVLHARRQAVASTQDIVQRIQSGQIKNSIFSSSHY